MQYPPTLGASFIWLDNTMYHGERFNSISHLVGAALALAGLVAVAARRFHLVDQTGAIFGGGQFEENAGIATDVALADSGLILIGATHGLVLRDASANRSQQCFPKFPNRKQAGEED